MPPLSELPITHSDPFLIDSHKLQYHPARVAQWLGAKTMEEKLAVYPIYVEISPVGHCNHRCTFCAVDYIGYKPRSLDTLTLCKHFTEMASAGVKSVMFAGEGEPLLHKDIALLTKAACVSGIDVSFTTNGVLLDKIIPVLGYIKWIKVSLNAGNEETYEKIHKAKRGDWDKVWSNIKRAVVERTDRLSPAIGIQTVVLPDNISSIEELIREAKEAGVDYVVLKPYSQHKSSLTTKYALLTYDEQLQSLTSLRDKYSTAVFKVIVRTNAMEDWNEGEHKYSKCSATPYMWAYIMATGDVYGCSAYLLDDRFNYGNINSNTFKEIWTGSKREESIKYVEEKLDIHECRLNCRMNQVNKYLDQVKQGHTHSNFI